MAFFNSIYSLGQKYEPVDSAHYKLKEAPPLTCCQKITSWLSWTVTYPLVTAHKLYNGYLLGRHKELSRPLEQTVLRHLPVSSFPFFNMNLNVVTKGMEVFLKPSRNNPEKGLFVDRVNKETFLKLIREMYPSIAKIAELLKEKKIPFAIQNNDFIFFTLGDKEKFLKLLQEVYPSFPNITEHLREKRIPYEIIEKDFLFTTHEDDVKIYRDAILSFIGPQHLHRIRKEISEIAPTVLEQFGESFDAQDFAGVFTSTVISKLLLNHPGPIEKYREIYKAIGNINKYAMQARWAKLSEPQQKEYKQAQQTMIDAIEVAIKNAGKESFVDALKGAGLSDIQIRTTLFLMYIAGIETTASILKYILWQIGQHPEYQKRFHSGENREELIAKLIDECLRLAPPISIIGRFAAKDLEFSQENSQGQKAFSIRIPKGDGILVAQGIAARDPQRYENPDQFNLDRFKIPLTHLPWLPFGGGYHACPGQWLARAELTTLLMMLLENYRIASTPSKPDLTPTLFMSLRHIESVKVILTRRI